jgi:hypothetical protein
MPQRLGARYCIEPTSRCGFFDGIWLGGSTSATVTQSRGVLAVCRDGGAICSTRLWPSFTYTSRAIGCRSAGGTSRYQLRRRSCMWALRARQVNCGAPDQGLRPELETSEKASGSAVGDNSRPARPSTMQCDGHGLGSIASGVGCVNLDYKKRCASVTLGPG